MGEVSLEAERNTDKFKDTYPVLVTLSSYPDMINRIVDSKVFHGLQGDYNEATLDSELFFKRQRDDFVTIGVKKGSLMNVLDSIQDYVDVEYEAETYGEFIKAYNEIEKGDKAVQR